MRGSGGTSRDFGIRATQQALELHKNPHSMDSPIWMIPNQFFFVQGSADQAQAIKDCADKFSANLPLPAGCKVTQFARAFNGVSLALYRPGTGTIWILKNENGVFSPVFHEGDPGNGIGGYNLTSPADRVFAFDR
jgi:hypothetical protein